MIQKESSPSIRLRISLMILSTIQLSMFLPSIHNELRIPFNVKICYAHGKGQSSYPSQGHSFLLIARVAIQVPIIGNNQDSRNFEEGKEVDRDALQSRDQQLKLPCTTEEPSLPPSQLSLHSFKDSHLEGVGNFVDS